MAVTTRTLTVASPTGGYNHFRVPAMAFPKIYEFCYDCCDGHDLHLDPCKRWITSQVRAFVKLFGKAPESVPDGPWSLVRVEKFLPEILEKVSRPAPQFVMQRI